MEKWKTVTFNDNYMVSSLGRVKSLRSGNYGQGEELILKGSVTLKGYVVVSISPRNTMSVHVLVAMMFKGFTPKRGLVVDHKDNDRANNAVGNLRILTHGENIARGKVEKPTTVSMAEALEAVINKKTHIKKQYNGRVTNHQ